jgi:hypothetical protein
MPLTLHTGRIQGLIQELKSVVGFALEQRTLPHARLLRPVNGCVIQSWRMEQANVDVAFMPLPDEHGPAHIRVSVHQITSAWQVMLRASYRDKAKGGDGLGWALEVENLTAAPPGLRELVRKMEKRYGTEFDSTAARMNIVDLLDYALGTSP